MSQNYTIVVVALQIQELKVGICPTIVATKTYIMPINESFSSHIDNNVVAALLLNSILYPSHGLKIIGKLT